MVICGLTGAEHARICDRYCWKRGRMQGRSEPEWQWSSFSTRNQPQRSAPAAAHAARLQEPAAVSAAPDLADRSSLLSLHNIRQALVRQEDTIIFALIERAQFARNDPVYAYDGVPVPSFAPDGRRHSPLEYLLRETEQLHGRIRRFTSPDEHAFFPDDLPALVLPPISFPTVLAPWSKDINLNANVMAMYLEHLLPGITQPGDDNNHGSAAMYDVLCLQALSKRVHYGKFVAEAKFLDDREGYSKLIEARDAEGIMALLTNTAVEKQVIARVRHKAAVFGQDYGQQHEADDRSLKINPGLVADLFEHWVMPLTKEVEVQYLLRRLEWDG